MHFILTRSEMRNKRLSEGDSDTSSDEDVNDKITTRQHEDVDQHNSIDGSIEESQA